jgi:GH24 family phage-related lysozyme (muramidase)
MYDSVKNVFYDFSVTFEGRVNHMYLDVKGLVTIGIGNLIDPSRVALTLPFQCSNGSLATKEQIAFEWRKMKLNKQLAQQGAGAAGRIASLHLSDEAISELVVTVLHRNDDALIHEIPAIRMWPADAQLAFHSMAWAMGTGFVHKFPRFIHSCLLQDWEKAASECLMKTAGNPGLIPRNRANQKLLLAADNVCKNGLDYATLTGWPE